MRTDYWQLQDAKAQFSQVVEAALRGEPQHVTRRGKGAVVVLSEASFEALQHGAVSTAPNVIEHLTAKSKVKSKQTFSFERANIKPREVDFK